MHRRVRGATLPPVRAWSVALVLGALAIAAYFLVPGLDVDLATALIGLACVGAILVATRGRRSDAAGRWQWFALGVALLVIGDALYTLLPRLGIEPFPSVADAAYLLGYLVLLPAVSRIVGHDEVGLFRPNLLDASIVASTAGIIVWRLVIDPITDASTSWTTTAIALAYPLADLALLFVLVRHLIGGNRAPAASLLVVGIAAMLFADLVYARVGIDDAYVSGSALDAGWLVAYVLFAVAALHPSMDRIAGVPRYSDSTSNRRIATIVAALFTGVIALMVGPQPTPSDRWIQFGWAGLLAVLCLVRLVGSLVQVRRLLGDATRLRADMEVQALTDRLTGLPNRAALTDAIDAALGAGRPVALLFLDLDKFKMVNDTYGHGAGDELLRDAARRLRRGVRGTDLVARLGGDEFAVLASPVRQAIEAEEIAARILAGFEEPFELAGDPHVIRSSIGISLAARGSDAAGLLREADVAMYDAKQRGGNRWRVYEKAHEAVVERYRLATELEQGIEAGELEVHYQPIVDLDEGSIHGVEALVRWNHPTRGQLAPGVFIPVAESAGLIGRLDLAVLRNALAQVRAWSDAGLWDPSLRVHVNVAPADIEDPSILDLLASALDEAGVQASALALEVTESALIDTATARRNLTDIAALGVTLALDDFGTRYAVLATLADLPFTTLKIDRSFVLTVGSPARARLFEGIVRLADRLGLETLAEGIETEEQRQAVRRLGCALGQGYLMARPMPAEAMGRLLARQARDRDAWDAAVLRLVADERDGTDEPDDADEPDEAHRPDAARPAEAPAAIDRLGAA